MESKLFDMEPPPLKTPRTKTHYRDEGLINPGNTKTTGLSKEDEGYFPCSTTPGSPSFSRSRLGKVTRLISRSDANLHNVRGGRNRNFSGDSTDVTQFSTEVGSSGEDGNFGSSGSPSKGFLSKATGYVSHLKSRIAKHRDKSKERENSGSGQMPKTTSVQPHLHQNPQHQGQGSFSACCGVTRGIDSSDTLAALGVPPGGNYRSESQSGEASNYSDSLSTNPITRIGGESSLDFESHQTTGKNLFGMETGTANSTFSGELELPGISNSSAQNTVMAPQSNHANAFYTLSVYLLRGKNLVARDACGSSDPYVKVKIGDKLYYKTKTIYRDLNPFWDESFVLPINDITQPIVFRVFDYDWGFQDDFMGMTSLDVSRLTLQKSQELSLTLTENNVSGETPMGDIILTVTLVPRSVEEKDVWLDNQSSTRLVDSQRRLKSQIWSSVLTVLLLEATNLSPMGDDKLLMDAFVKFRLGSQKYKSRTVSRSASPKWLEQFDLYLYEGQPQVLEIQLYDEAFSRDYIGRCSVDIGLLEKEMTHSVTLPLLEGPGQIGFLFTISGTSGTETISDLTNYKPSTEEITTITTRYTLGRSFHNLKDVGHLTVKVYEAQGLAAADIGGKSDPFVVLELVNARLQTQTEYRTLTPCWNKIFTFAVKDITSILEVTVYDEDTNHKTEFLGKIHIPLWKITNGEKKWYVLKDRKLIRRAKGSNPQILLEMDLIWNPIRAGLRVMDPPEPKFLVPDQRLNREIFLLNIDRLRTICVGIYDVMQYVQSCMEWESPVRSIIALFLYQIICYTFQPFMIPLFLMLLILKTWFVCALTGSPLPEEYPEEGETLVLDDDDETQGDGEEKKMSLRQKLQAVQDATQTLQNALGSIASICESTRNTFRMVVPFISWLAVLGLFVGTVVLYLIPMRYLAMAWGLHRFLRPILRPNVKPTDEVYNLLLRVPDNQELIIQKPLRVTQVPDTVQRNRSPLTKAPHQKKKHKFW